MDIADISVDPHYRERGTIVDVADDDFGALPMVSPLPHLSETPGRIRTTGPALGEANHEVYGGLLGISEVELAGLREDGVL
jgi:crotonobetainyl-CoA:carnitine CoA-transferase CaiB-like acyl-CoA transferase